uniref:Acetyltransferase (GNAT) family protein n=1 Tax=Candidatus Kentrum sp. FM TaxID=2126340 RepID=A0A450THD3_9GAMM|nr:MAG: Acetyltransferase (GNAT) family protein [Candidatus Kentron sp. FM]VFJ66628.1 MAG: Acetyltransferase (GNAT) family protein [Candidatus Kentron sp. FM]VFK12894.1 MAG: Acetyltransferase (GNAT) family protein [Candidatus Kentron sp. FM]
MSRVRPLVLAVETPALKLIAQEAPWDSAVFATPVVQIEQIAVRHPDAAIRDYAAHYRSWLNQAQVGLVSCRLPHDRLVESMFLEAHGFRFIEMVLHPRLAGLSTLALPADDLQIASVNVADLPGLVAIAEQTFSHERYHVDPRLDPRLGNLRYGRWVRSSLEHPTQRLLKVLDAERLIALFLVENRADASAYWHLTAIAPSWQGQGYGQRVWRAMLRRHQAEGCESVTTTISARNTPVLNLYAQLGFRFLPPEMTFHWIRETT